MTTPKGRASASLAAYITYSAVHGENRADDNALADLLADLMHWADSEPDIDFDSHLDAARMYYNRERD